MFTDDLALCREARDRFGPLPVGPIVEVGGIANPCLAAYDVTIERMAAIRGRTYSDPAAYEADVRAAQLARYQNTRMPLSFLGDYTVEDPGSGGCSIETLSTKYPGTIGTLICLSTLEHCEDVWYCPEYLREAMRPGGLLVASVPFLFPNHPSPKDLWRFTPDALLNLFESPEGAWEILWCDWRLRIDADAGVQDIHTGKPQAVHSCALIARAR